MATERKGSTSKAGGVRFPDDDNGPPGSPTSREDQSNLSALIAVKEKDGSYLVKAGFLKSHHCYEIVFSVPDVPTLGKELSCLPSCSPSRKPQSLRINRINSSLEGVKVTCEYRTHQEGVLQEEVTLATRGKKATSLKVRLQAKVIDPHHGTPMLLEGVRCLGARRDAHTRQNSDRKRVEWKS